MAGLISINKPHTDNIFSGDKGLEWRKSPLPEDLYYVYETKNKGGCGMVIGEMRIVGSKAVDTSGPLEVCLVNDGCVHPVALKKYANNGVIYANFIKGAMRYDKPKELAEFWSADKCPYASKDGCTYEYHCFRAGKTKRCGSTLQRPPQSWCRVEELENG